MAQACAHDELGKDVFVAMSTRLTQCDHGNVFLHLLDVDGSVSAVAGFSGASALTLALTIIQAAGAHVAITPAPAADPAVH